MIAAEHIVLGIKFLIESVIPDVPEWVENALKRQDYLEEKWHLKMKQPEQYHRDDCSPIMMQKAKKAEKHDEDGKENSITLKRKIE